MSPGEGYPMQPMYNPGGYMPVQNTGMQYGGAH